MSLFRSSLPALRVAPSTTASLAGRRALTTTFVRRTDDPNVLDKDTHSGASVKADKHSKDPHTLQKETARSANNDGGSGSAFSATSKPTASPNDAPTHSEDAVHGEKHSKSPKQLQKETAQKMGN